MSSEPQEGQSQINAAKERLAVAEKWEASTADMLKAALQMVENARLQSEKSKKELNEARARLNEVEKKWEVIDVDSENYHVEDSGRKRKRTPVKVKKEETGNDRRKMSNSIDSVIVEGCGDDEINGTYNKCGTRQGYPMYSKSGQWDGEEVDFKIYLFQHSDKEKNWIISVVPGEIESGYFESEEDIDLFEAPFDGSRTPPEKDWTKVGRVKGDPPSRVYPKVD